MATKKVLVSICIPTHNRAQFLKQTIHSVLAQTYKDFELIICDDASVDATQDVIQSFKDKRIRKLKNNTNKGYIGTMNMCTKLAKGEWIMHLSDDDLMEPQLLEEQVRVIRTYKDEEVAYIVPQSSSINSKGNSIATPTSQLTTTSEIFLRPKEAIPNFTLYGKKIQGKYQFNTSFPSTLFNKKIFLKEGMSSEKVPVAHDLLIMAQLCLKYSVIFLDRPLFLYRVHENWGASVNTQGTFLKEYQQYLSLLLEFVKKQHITFSYDFKKYCYDSLVTYVFAINGGLVRIGGRMRAPFGKKLYLLLEYIQFGIHHKKNIVLYPSFYISIFAFILPGKMILFIGKILRKI